LENNNRYKIYPELNFGVAKLDPGPKSIIEIYKLARTFREDKNFNKVFYQLTDLRGCIFNFDIEEINQIKSLIELYKNVDNQKLVIYLVDLPNETAYTHMFFESLNRESKYCSTPDKAYDLLHLPLSKEEFNKLISI